MQPFGKICLCSWAKFVQKKSNHRKKSLLIALLIALTVAKFDTKVSKIPLLCKSILMDVVEKSLTASICIANCHTHTVCIKCLRTLLVKLITLDDVEHFVEQVEETVHKQLCAEVHPNGVLATKCDWTNPLGIELGEQSCLLLVEMFAKESTHQKPSKIGEKCQVVATPKLAKAGNGMAVLRKEKPNAVVVRPRFYLCLVAHDKHRDDDGKHNPAVKVVLPIFFELAC